MVASVTDATASDGPRGTFASPADLSENLRARFAARADARRARRAELRLRAVGDPAEDELVVGVVDVEERRVRMVLRRCLLVERHRQKLREGGIGVDAAARCRRQEAR